MPHPLNPFQSLDAYFLVCKIFVGCVSLVWPLTALASVMSLAAQFPDGTPLLEVVAVRLGWLAVLAYPVVFFAVVLVAERLLAPRVYPVAAVVALLPVAVSAVAVGWFVAS